MTTAFPTALDDFTNPTATDNLGSSTVPHATQHANANDAIEALEAKVGITNSTDQDSLDYRVNNGIFSGGIVLGKAAGIGIKLDSGEITYGWRDITGGVHIRGTGAADPSWNVYRSGIRQFQFSVNDECCAEFHIPHDYVPGTDLHIHAHWSLNAAGVTENVTWGFECTYSKGHQQAAFHAPITATKLQASSTTQYFHNIAEVQLSSLTPTANQLDTNLIEVDGIILCRTFLSANSGATKPFLHFVDIHYQSSNMATKQKAPSFYA